jgi:MFS family permease
MVTSFAALMSEQQFEDFGWRIPFLLSIALIVVGAYLRANVSETPAFEAMVEKRKAALASATPIPQARSHSLKDHVRTIIRLILFWATPASCFWIVNIYSISFLEARTALTRETIFACIMAANLVSVVTTIIGGASSDRFGRKPPLIVTSLIMLVISIFYFDLISTGNIAIIIAAMAVFGGCIQAQSGILPAYFAEQFPTSVRYTGSALSYTGANLIFAGPTPFVAAWIAEKSNGSTAGLTAFCVTLVLVSFTALLMSPETRGVNLAADY